jgi:undecaprenyl pyrophosphate phosphatase UppP
MMNGMWTKIVQITSIISITIVFGSAFAHLLEAYNKMRLSKNEYQVAQQLYRGWALLAVVVLIALFSTMLLAIQTRHQPEFMPNLLSTICIALAVIIFFVFIFPVNQQTENWTILPDNWMHLRNRWEFSHIASAVLYFVALLLVVVPLVIKR